MAVHKNHRNLGPVALAIYLVVVHEAYTPSTSWSCFTLVECSGTSAFNNGGVLSGVLSYMLGELCFLFLFISHQVFFPLLMLNRFYTKLDDDL